MVEKTLHILAVSEKFFREKIGLYPLKKKMQHFAPFPKLFKEMSFFWNQIFLKMEFKKIFGAL